jgi:hypothetical protein
MSRTRSGRDVSRAAQEQSADPINILDRQNEPPVNDAPRVESSPEPSRQPSPSFAQGPIDPATFQQQMFMMMNLLTQSIAAQTRQPSATPAHNTSKEPKVKDPETFHGQRDTLNAFLTECELIFELQPSRFVDNRTKVSYMISLLRGTPLLAVRPLLSQIPRPIILEDFALFVDYLRTNYGDPDEKGTARRKLKALRQIGPASSYFAEFQQYIAIPGWKDQDPIVDRAIDGLKPYLKDEVARTGLQPRSLSDLISFIVPLDNRLYEREQERRRETKETNSKPITSSGTTTVTRPTPNVGQYNRGPLNTGTRPVGSPATAIPRGPLSAEERQRRRDNNLCLYCGNGGHLAQNCPNAPPARSIPRGDSTSVQVKVEDGPRPSPSAGNAKAPST